MYKCYGCNSEFEEPSYVSYGRFYGVGGRGSDPQLAVCPYCESDEYDELSEDDMEEVEND